MYTTTLPISLVLAGALMLVNIWLSFRVGQVRAQAKVSIGDGGHEPLVRRMRAHSNFSENAPLTVLLVALIEFAASPSVWLWGMAGLFLLARIAHGLGMDGRTPFRMFGAGATAIVQLLLALWAISIVATGAYSDPVRDADPVERQAQG